MKYFCAECQKKHEITDIAADLYEVCIEEMRSNLLSVGRFGNSEEFKFRHMRIQKFLNAAEYSKKFFLFQKDALIAHISNPVWTGNTVSGTFQLDFRWLLEAYKNSGKAEKDDEEVALAAQEGTVEPLLPLDQFNEDAKNCLLFSKNMDFVFTTAYGSTKDLVFSYIAPGHGDREVTYSGMSHKRSCPHCGKNVSQALGKAPEIVVALAGNPRAGKTSCITAISSALRSGRYMDYGLSMSVDENDDQWNRLKDEIDSFDKGYVVTKTPADPDFVPSYSYLIRIGDSAERVVTFVDMPGEFWQAGKGLAVEFYNKYAGLYENIDCVWFFISKLAVHRFDLGKDEIDDDLEYEEGHDQYYREIQKKLRQKTADSADTIDGSSPGKINSILEQLRTHLESRNKQMPPFAIILTKSEVVHHEGNREEIMDMEKYMLFPAKGGNIIQNNLVGINNNELNKVLKYNATEKHHFMDEFSFHGRGALVRHYMRKHNDSLRKVIERNCPRLFYFSMAAYGHAAAVPPGSDDDIRKDEGIKPSKPTPFHEMYPLLWTLAISDTLHVKHIASWYYPGTFDRITGGRSGEWNEGTIEELYDYKGPANPTGSRLKEKKEDAKLLHEGISANLLMNGENSDKRIYTKTQFDHPRR